MIAAFKMGFGFTAGAIAAAVSFLIILGGWDLLIEFIKYIRKGQKPKV